jgi:RHS repeat-associated protein
VTQTFDPAGRESEVVDGNSNETVSCYDNDNRVIKVFYNVTVTINCVTTTTPRPDIVYTYDADGNLTQKVDNDSATTTTISYDNLDRPVTQATDTAATCTVTIPHGPTYTGDSCVTYDPDGNIAAYTDSNGTVAYSFDAANRNVLVQEPGASCAVGGTPTAGCVALAYDTNGNLVQETAGANEKIVSTYDTSNRLITRTTTAAGTTVAALGYTYTAPGAGGADSSLERNETTTLVTPTTPTTPTTNTATYDYDNANRLCWAATQTGTTGITNSSCTTPTGSGLTTLAYNYNGYNDTSNITSSTGSVQNFAYNQADQLCWAVNTTVTGHTCGTVPTGSTTYTFDGDGNQTGSTAGFAATYNPASQTTSLTADTGGTATNLAYQDAGETERLSAGTTTFTNTLLGVGAATIAGTTYTSLRDANGDLLGLIQGTHTYYNPTDALGSVIAINNGTGATQATYTYDPYGNTTIGINTSNLATTNPWRYDGGYYDTTTGDYHYGARYYDPTTARWTQLDPSGKNPGYTYAGNDPINELDPSGHDATCIVEQTCPTYDPGDGSEPTTNQVEGAVATARNVHCSRSVFRSRNRDASMWRRNRSSCNDLRHYTVLFIMPVHEILDLPAGILRSQAVLVEALRSIGISKFSAPSAHTVCFILRGSLRDFEREVTVVLVERGAAHTELRISSMLTKSRRDLGGGDRFARKLRDAVLHHF